MNKTPPTVANIFVNSHRLLSEALRYCFFNFICGLCYAVHPSSERVQNFENIYFHYTCFCISACLKYSQVKPARILMNYLTVFY